MKIESICTINVAITTVTIVTIIMSTDQVVKVEEERGPRRGIVKMDSLEVEGEVVYDRWSWLILYHIMVYIMESHHTMVSDREGVIVQAKREDRLHSGRLKVTDTRC